MYKTIDVLISTYGDRVNDVFNILLPYDKRVRYLICHQGFSDLFDISRLENRPDVSYYHVETVGVTKSRNFLIEKSTSDIVYFCDDDVKLSSDFIQVLLSSHGEFDAPVITFSVADQDGNLRKNYPSVKDYTKRSIFQLMSVGTVEISVKRKELNNFRFPEDQGAGCKYSTGDEAVFLSHFFRRGCEIGFVPEVICFHPAESSGATVSSGAIYSRGMTIRRVYGVSGFFLLFPFMLLRKKLFFNKNMGFFESISNFFIGFIKG